MRQMVFEGGGDENQHSKPFQTYIHPVNASYQDKNMSNRTADGQYEASEKQINLRSDNHIEDRELNCLSGNV